jgi:hypothetical protein
MMDYPMVGHFFKLQIVLSETFALRQFLNAFLPTTSRNLPLKIQLPPLRHSSLGGEDGSPFAHASSDHAPARGSSAPAKTSAPRLGERVRFHHVLFGQQRWRRRLFEVVRGRLVQPKRHRLSGRRVVALSRLSVLAPLGRATVFAPLV